MIYDLAPMAQVANVSRSIKFYSHLGFKVRSCFGEPEPFWAALQSNLGILMLSRASKVVTSEQQGVLFYLYTADLQAVRQSLQAAGVTMSEVCYPPYMPEGQMTVSDPDGYCLLIGQSDCWRRAQA